MLLKNRHHRHALLALITTGTAVFSTQAFAQYEANAYAGSEFPFAHTTTPGDVTYTYVAAGAAGTSAGGTVSFTANPVASVSVEASVANPVGQSGIGLSGTMTYSFEVAAQPFSSVPIDFSGLYSSYVDSTYVTGNGQSATTRFAIQTATTSAQFISYFFGNCGNAGCLQYSNTYNATYTTVQSDALHVAGSFDGTLDVLTNADGKGSGFVLLAAAGGATVFPGTATVSSFIDPHLEIDAAYLAAHPGATLTITPGVGNEISAVPEPSTYALMLAGLSAIVVSGRRAKSHR